MGIYLNSFWLQYNGPPPMTANVLDQIVPTLIAFYEDLLQNYCVLNFNGAKTIVLYNHICRKILLLLRYYS